MNSQRVLIGLVAVVAVAWLFMASKKPSYGSSSSGPLRGPLLTPRWLSGNIRQFGDVIGTGGPQFAVDEPTAISQRAFASLPQMPTHQMSFAGHTALWNVDYPSPAGAAKGSIWDDQFERHAVVTD